jgi:predicted O-methyltransferase YrrM
VNVPPLVARAHRAAAEAGLECSCRDEDGLLLHVLAARRGVDRVAEIGSGVGVGTAWLASALPPGAPLFTAELDAERAAAATAVFADDPDVHVLHGDWRALLPPLAPFDLLFVGAGDAKADPDAVVGLAMPGATLVLDVVSSDPAGPGTRRARWLGHPRLTTVEIATDAGAHILVAVVRR